MSTISEPVEVEKKTTPDDVDIDDTNARYAAYLNRIRTIMRASHRYVAYSSDVGELFRPVAHPGMIKAAYALSFGYVGALVAYDAWKVGLAAEGKYRPGLMPWQPTPPADPKAKAQFLETHPKRYENDWRVAAVKGAIFQLVASMALPAFTIHLTVRYSSVLFKNASNPKIKTWGPVALGLAVVPALPYIFDEPVEHVVDWAFDELEKFY